VQNSTAGLLLKSAITLPFAFVSYLRLRLRRPSSRKVDWGMGRSMPREREDVLAAALDGKIYAVAGFEPGPGGPVISARAERYDPASDSWEELPPLPVARHHAMIAPAAGKIYVFGGHGDLKNATTFNETYALDLRRRKWERKADMPCPRAGGGAAVLGGKIYLVGGRIGGSVLEGNFKPPLLSVDIYDPKSDKWERGVPMRIPRDHLGVAVLEGKIYAIGGRVLTLLNPTSAVEIFDPSSGRWEIGQSLPAPVSGEAIVLGKRIILPGCVFGLLGPAFTLSYSPEDGWELLGTVSGGGYAHSMAEMGGIGYILGESPNLGFRYSNLARTVRV